MKTKTILAFLVVISLISLGFKLYLTDFSIPLHSDNLAYALNAIAHTNGDFSQPPHRAIGWSLFLSPSSVALLSSYIRPAQMGSPASKA